GNRGTIYPVAGGGFLSGHPVLGSRAGRNHRILLGPCSRCDRYPACSQRGVWPQPWFPHRPVYWYLVLIEATLHLHGNISLCRSLVESAIHFLQAKIWQPSVVWLLVRHGRRRIPSIQLAALRRPIRHG